MILKQVIRYTNADALEATWVEVITLPQQEIAPGIADLALRTQEVVVKCQAYANNQMALLAADLGTDAPQYQALMNQVAATYVAPPPPVPQVPQAVTMRQARLALDAAGLLDGVEAAIAAIANPAQRRKAQIEWEFAADVQRNHGLVPTMATALGMTEAQIDALFMQAATL